MAGNKDRVYWNDSKMAVRRKLGLEDNEDFHKFEVELLLTSVIITRTSGLKNLHSEHMFYCVSIQAVFRPSPQLG